MDELDRLVTSTWECAARMALAEAHRLLTARRHDDAADALLIHFDSIVARSRTYLDAQQAIDKAREAA